MLLAPLVGLLLALVIGVPAQVLVNVTPVGGLLGAALGRRGPRVAHAGAPPRRTGRHRRCARQRATGGGCARDRPQVRHRSVRRRHDRARRARPGRRSRGPARAGRRCRQPRHRRRDRPPRADPRLPARRPRRATRRPGRRRCRERAASRRAGRGPALADPCGRVGRPGARAGRRGSPLGVPSSAASSPRPSSCTWRDDASAASPATCSGRQPRSPRPSSSSYWSPFPDRGVP